ncbi:MAG: PAS domain-containing protein, partial [Alphaproteobacteria bacterium]
MQPIEKMLRHLPVVIFQLQLFDNGKITFPYISESAIAILGQPASEIMSDSSIIIVKIHSNHVFPLKRALVSSRKTLSSLDCEIQINHKEKGFIWVNITATAERLDNRTVWYGCLKDVAKEKEKYVHLVENERKYWATLENSINGFIIGKDGAVLDANEAAIKMFGYDNLADM